MRGWITAGLLCLASPGLAAVVDKPLSWSLDGTEFAGVLVYDDAAKNQPGLLMVPNWMGVNASAADKARAIAAKGYVVLVADVYGKDVRPANADEAGKAAGAMYADRNVLRARAAAALEQLKAQATTTGMDSGKIGAIGFCFGGATVIELARSGRDDIRGVVSFHGALNTSMPAAEGAVKASVLALNGADDSYVSAEHITAFQNEMRAAKADWQFVNYAGAVHCFAEADANSGPGCQYHARSAQRAYRAMQDFFGERFATP